MSAAGITLEAGLTTSRGVARRRVQRRARRVRAHVALLDATKFGRASLVSIVAARELDLIITDDGLDAEVAAAFGQNQRRG